MSHNLILTDAYGEKELCVLFSTSTEETFRVLGQKDFPSQMEMYIRILIDKMYKKNENCQWLIDHIYEIKLVAKNWPNCKFNWI